MDKMLTITSDEKYYCKIENDIVEMKYQSYWAPTIKEARKMMEEVAVDIIVFDQEDLTQKACFSFIKEIANNPSIKNKHEIDFVSFYVKEPPREIKGYASFSPRFFLKGTEKRRLFSLLKYNLRAKDIEEPEEDLYEYGPIILDAQCKRNHYGNQKDIRTTRTEYYILKEFLKYQGEIVPLNKLKDCCATKYFYPSARTIQYAISRLKIKMPILAKKLIPVIRKGYLLKNIKASQGDIRE